MWNIYNRKITIKALNLSRFTKRFLAIFLDIIFCILSNLVVLHIILDPIEILNWQFVVPTLISICIAIPIFLYVGIYRVIYRYVNDDTLKVLTKSIIIYTLLFFLIFVVFGVQGIPGSIGLMQPMMFSIHISTAAESLTI